MRVLVIALLLVGCKDYEEPCRKIIDHYIEVGARQYTEGMSEADKAEFVEQLEGRRSKAMETCEDGKPEDDDVECALKGQTVEEINACAWFRRAGVGGGR